MEGGSESDRGGDEVYSATFGDQEKKRIKTGLMMMMILTHLKDVLSGRNNLRLKGRFGANKEKLK